MPCEFRVRDIIDIVQAIQHRDAERADDSHAEQYIICEPKNTKTQKFYTNRNLFKRSDLYKINRASKRYVQAL